MPIKNTAVYIDENGKNIYTVYVSAMGMSARYLETVDHNSRHRRECMKMCQSVIAGGFCLATNDQVNIFDRFVSHNKLHAVDCMYYPDGMSRPTVMMNLWENAHDYDIGMVMTTPDLASFYIKRSNGYTLRLFYVSKTAVTRAITFHVSKS